MVIRKAGMVTLTEARKKEAEKRRSLQLDLDYNLVSLHRALQDNDAKEVVRIKAILTDLHRELNFVN